MRLRIFTALLLAAFIATPAAFADPTLTLGNGGSVSGAPGSSVNWDFTLSNTTDDFMVITGTSFCDTSSMPGFTCDPVGTSLGSYSDILGQNFIIVGPSPESSSITQIDTGLGTFTFNLDASGSATGEIIVTYDLFSTDPNSPTFDPSIDLINPTELAMVASASVTASNGNPTPVPEPASFVLLGSGILGLGTVRRKLFRR